MSPEKRDDRLYGLLGKIRAVPGKRDELVARLEDTSRNVPGKLVYLISLEKDDPDAFWITEVWRDKAAYEAVAGKEGREGRASVQSLVLALEHRVETIPLESSIPYRGNGR
ncbi:MAG: antibiotic biosynthesis monooxygenase family protein [Novosphingobium sp.]